MLDEKVVIVLSFSWPQDMIQFTSIIFIKCYLFSVSSPLFLDMCNLFFAFIDCFRALVSHGFYCNIYFTLFDREAKTILFRYNFMKSTISFLGILLINNIIPVNSINLFTEPDNILMSHISIYYIIWFTFTCLLMFCHVKYCVVIRYITAKYTLFMICGYVKVICEDMVD